MNVVFGRKTVEPTIDEEYDDDEDFDAYSYLDIQKIRSQSNTLPHVGTKPSPPARRLTYDDVSRPDIEDSDEGFDPYVRMNSFQGPDLRVTASRANKRAKAIRQRRELSGVPEEGQDLMSREEFLGKRLMEPLRRTKPAVAPKPSRLSSRRGEMTASEETSPEIRQPAAPSQHYLRIVRDETPRFKT